MVHWALSDVCKMQGSDFYKYFDLYPEMKKAFGGLFSIGKNCNLKIIKTCTAAT